MKRIFATQTGGWIGDMVLLGPALRALRGAFPEAHIALQVRPRVRELMERHPDLDEVLVWDKEHERGLRGFAETVRRVREARFDAAIVWHPTSVRSAILAWGARIPIRVGHRIGGRGLFLTRSLPNAHVHETERYLRVLALLDLPKDRLVDREIFFWHGKEERRFAECFFTENGLDGGGPVVGIHLGTTWPTKCWLTERFAEVASVLSRRGCHVLVTGAAEDRPLLEAFARTFDGNVFAEAVGRCDLFESAALIERCDLFLTADSGPMHIAAAVGTRTVALFGPTSPVRHGPVGTGHRTIQTDLACVPCYKRTCRLRDRYRCMRAIEPSHVLRAIEEAL